MFCTAVASPSACHAIRILDAWRQHDTSWLHAELDEVLRAIPDSEAPAGEAERAELLQEIALEFRRTRAQDRIEICVNLLEHLVASEIAA